MPNRFLSWQGKKRSNVVHITSIFNEVRAEIYGQKPCVFGSLMLKKHVAACDYVGVVSGKDEPDKVSKAGFTTARSQFVNAPVINELPITLECELVEASDDGRYLGRIINVSADERFVGSDGEPDISKFTPITYDPVHNKYIALGEIVGNAFSDGLKLK